MLCLFFPFFLTEDNLSRSFYVARGERSRHFCLRLSFFFAIKRNIYNRTFAAERFRLRLFLHYGFFLFGLVFILNLAVEASKELAKSIINTHNGEIERKENIKESYHGKENYRCNLAYPRNEKRRRISCKHTAANV